MYNPLVILNKEYKIAYKVTLQRLSVSFFPINLLRLLFYIDVNQIQIQITKLLVIYIKLIIRVFVQIFTMLLFFLEFI